MAEASIKLSIRGDAMRPIAFRVFSSSCHKFEFHTNSRTLFICALSYTVFSFIKGGVNNKRRK